MKITGSTIQSVQGYSYPAMATAPQTEALAAASTEALTYDVYGEKISLDNQTIKAYLVSGDPSKVSDQECVMYAHFCKGNGLNPFNKDCYLIKYSSSDNAAMVVAHSALMQRADSHPAFDGLSSGIIVRQADGVIAERPGSIIFDGETLLGGWAVIYRKDRGHNAEKRINFAPYNTGKSRWAKDPCGMIVKVAEAQAIRQAFPCFKALYTIDEMEAETGDIASYQPRRAAQPARPAYVVDDLPEAPAGEEDDPFKEENEA